MRLLLLHRVVRPASNRARSLSWLSCWQTSDSSTTGFTLQNDFSHGANRQRVLFPVGPTGFVVQPSAHIQRTGSLSFDHSEVWQAFDKAPNDNPPDQPKTTLDRQDVPATKPGMDAPESPDAANPEIDRSDYSAPGTNPDVAENDGNEYKPDRDSVDDLKKRGRTGTGKLPGSDGQHAAAYNNQPAHMPFTSRGLFMLRGAPMLHLTGAGRNAELHVCAVGSNADDGDVGKDDSAASQPPREEFCRQH
ncbi:TPA: hypothetical protein ACH3X1_008132 [Trebouxia sp. C0004]